MNASEISNSFVKAISAKFDDVLLNNGFERIRQHADKDGFSVVYRSGERYIEFNGTLNPRDFPLFFSLSFGEGSTEFPESDWNAIPIFLFQQHLDPDEYEGSMENFSIGMDISVAEIRKKIKKILEQFMKYGQPFLNNDLTLFRKLRAAQNKGREPYKIYTTQEGGKYKMTYEKRSSELKDKYSKSIQ